MKKTLSLLYVSALIFFLLIEAVVNSEPYRDRFGSESLTLIAIGLGIVFWIWMLIDLMTTITRGDEIHRPWLWSVFVVLTYVVGAFVYYVVIYYPKHSRRLDRP